MLGGVFPLLILTDCGRVSGAAPGRAPKIPRSEYANFGGFGRAWHSVLEDQVVGSLYKCCSACDCPEIKHDILDGRLPSTDFGDKVRYVVFTMLAKTDQAELGERLLETFGYAGRLLLRRLYSSPSIERLTRVLDAKDNTEPRQVFRRAAVRYRSVLKENYQCLEKMVVVENRKPLLQLADNGSGQDLAIHAIKAANGPGDVTLNTAFIELASSWPDTPAKRDKRMSVITEFLQIALMLRPWRNDEQSKLRESIVRHVYESCDTERECFELLHIFPQQQSISPLFYNYMIKELNREASPSFVRKYLDYIQENFSSFTEGSYNFFLGLLPPLDEFHTTGLKWRSDPERFNLISPRWLREMFENLRDSPPIDGSAVTLTREYMGILKFDVFIRILMPFTQNERITFALSMLEHQNVKGIMKYCRCFIRDFQRTDLDRRVRGVLNVLECVFRPLVAQLPAFYATGRGPSGADQQHGASTAALDAALQKLRAYHSKINR